MTHTLSNAALIPAAGLGTRLGLGPKALLRLGERTLLEILVSTLSPVVDALVVAAPDGFENRFESILEGEALVVLGAGTRQESIDRMIDACAAEVLLIQDVSRPFASRALCAQVLEAATNCGAAGAFLDPTVPVGLLEDGAVGSYWDRQRARIFQAPQAFTRDVLESAKHRTAGLQFQSTAQMVMQAGHVLQAVTGEPENIKITAPLDWLIAQQAIAPTLGLV